MIRAKVDIMARPVPKGWILVFVAFSLVYNAQSCPDLRELPRGVITYRTVSTRVVATYRCTATGYRLLGERKLRCQDDGTWSNDVPICRPMPICPEIEEGNHLVRQRINGRRRDGLWVFGSRHNFTCGDGFVLSDPSMSAIECNRHGWNASTPTCIESPRCPPLLDEIENGRSTAQNRTYAPGDIIQFICNEGYATTSQSWRTCSMRKSNNVYISTWLGETPSCEEGNERFEAELTSDSNNSDLRNRSGFIPLTHPVGVELYFMFDASMSIGVPNFNIAKDFAKGLVKEIGVTSRPNSLRVGAMVFSSQADVAFHTSELETTEDVVAAINMIEYKGGGTNLALAFDRLLNAMIPQSREGSFKTVFLLADGDATEGGNPKQIADLVKGSGVTIHCIGITQDASREALNNLASDPLNEHLFFLERYEDIDILIKIVTNQSLDYSECGKSQRNTLVRTLSQKTPASAGAWPWQVLFDITKIPGTRYICGGTLIKPDWILTAAHCFHEIDSFEAYAGIRDRRDPRSEMELDANQTIIIHPDYDSATKRNDIALIHLRKPAKLGPSVRPACLPDPAKENRLLYRGTAVMTGWGHNGRVGRDGNSPLHPEMYLQQITLPLRSREECTDSLIGETEEVWFNEGMTCAGYLNLEVGACQGDSGGPLVKNAKVDNQRRWVVIGINSWSIGCALRNELDFFTNVPHFMGWINGHISPAVVPDD